jgi:O-acetyl-ADP-ribose deacetylase (regulator of RNase III)
MFVPVENDIVVANMIGQHDTCPDENGQPPIRYNAVRAALKGVNELATQIDATIHMPRIGCGLAGASWDLILPIIEETCTVNVYVYDLK